MKFWRFDKCCFVLEVYSICMLLDEIFFNVILLLELKLVFEYWVLWLNVVWGYSVFLRNNCMCYRKCIFFKCVVF